MANTIDRLKEYLNLYGLPSNRDYDSYFSEIANLLMNKCAIAKGDSQYEIIEIEFYLYTAAHPDVITYPRQIDAGQWFFHQSGIDLTFKSQGIEMITFDKGRLLDKPQFGGILIRAIKPVNGENSQVIWGPQNCTFELWDKFNALEADCKEYPIIVEADKKSTSEISRFPRWIPLYKKDKSEKINDWIKRITESEASDIEIGALADIVFDSLYRFIKKDAMDMTNESWKKYAAKPKT